MSDTINLAGKNLIVDNIDSTEADAKSLLSMRLAIQQARSVNSAGLSKEENKVLAGKLSRLGGKKTSGYNGKLDVFAYNPSTIYNDSYSSDYYVSVGYAICNGDALPVSLPNKYMTFTPATKEGVWAVIIRKVNVADEAYTPFIAYPFADGQTMKWYAIDNQGTATTLASVLDTWIVGSFSYTALNGVSEITIAAEGISPQTFLNGRFLQILGAAKDGDRTDFSNWAYAMKVDQIFERLAVLELFVDSFYANYVTVGANTRTTTSGFSFKAHKDGGPNNAPVFDIYYNDNCLFKVDVTTGRIYFGTNFWYSPTDGAIHSTSDKVVIGSDGTLQTTDAVVNGAITASQFRFGYVKMKWLYLSYDGDGLHHVIDLTNNGASVGDLVVINWANFDSEPIPQTSLAFILDDGARGLNCTSTLVENNGTKIEYVRGNVISPTFGYGIRTTTSHPVQMYMQIYHDALND